jgi:uncharacterized membrane protein
MRIKSPGHLAFAAIMIALGIQGLITGKFTAVWPPVPSGVPAREALVYLSALVSLGAGLGLCWTRTAALASRVLFATLALWLLAVRGHDLVRAHGAFDAWDGAAETATMTAGAWVLYVWSAADRERAWFDVAAGAMGLRIARTIYGLALVSFGLAHFVYFKDTAGLVPGWLPAHAFWAALTGGAFIAAAAAVLTGVRAQLAASLVIVEIGAFTVLVWVPVVASGTANAFAWSEFAISGALTAAAWVLADSYRAPVPKS